MPGLGARRAKQLWEAIGVDSLESLERACLEGRLSSVKGFGSKSAERILRGIELLRRNVGLHLYHRARAAAEATAARLRGTGLASRIEIAGSLCRRCELIRDADFVAASEEPERLARAFRELPGVAEVVASSPTKTTVRLAEGLAADLRVVSEEVYAAALLYFTGSKEHNTQLRGRAKRRGWILNEYGLFHEPRRLAGGSEAEIYAALGLPFIEPELREGRGEIEAAERGELPVLVTERDLRGLIHVHTTESDGRDGLSEMVAATKAAGYRYVVITDHSVSAGYAGGLSPARVLAQRDEIRALAARHPDFRIFHGTEADILADGTVDYGDELLSGFDLVVASVHSRFGLSREQQTTRLVTAIRNPLVSVLGHPSGRLLLSRDPISADWEAVVDAAAAAGCALEINGNPHRLDLDWRHGRRAVEKGALLSIDPDAHSVGELALVGHGVGIARKGWVTPQATLNARGADELAAWLERRRGRPLPQS